MSLVKSLMHDRFGRMLSSSVLYVSIILIALASFISESFVYLLILFLIYFVLKKISNSEVDDDCGKSPDFFLGLFVAIVLLALTVFISDLFVYLLVIYIIFLVLKS